MRNKRVTEAQIRVLKGLRDHDSPSWYFDALTGHGAAARALYALRDKGFVAATRAASARGRTRWELTDRGAAELERAEREEQR